MGVTNGVLLNVRIIANGVLSTIPVSLALFTYWLALLMVMGRVAEEKPPRMPAMVRGVIIIIRSE